jgi:hypothetical protein
MSIPDHDIDEPSDDELCQLHMRYRPCRDCRTDEQDRLFDLQRERTLEVRAQRIARSKRN